MIDACYCWFCWSYIGTSRWSKPVSLKLPALPEGLGGWVATGGGGKVLRGGTEVLVHKDCEIKARRFLTRESGQNWNLPPEEGEL